MVIAFDAYGTLWDVNRLQEACVEAVGPEEAGPLLALWRQKQLEYAFLRTLMGQFQPFDAITEAALVYSLKARGLVLEESSRQKLLRSWWSPTPFPDAISMLQQLKGWTRIILSNGDPGMLSHGVAASHMDTVLDDVLSVLPAQCYKPHPKTYQLVCDKFRVRPDEVVFVSSNGWDVAGAHHFGFRTFWVNRYGMPVEGLDAEPVAVVPRLADLPAALNALSR